MGVLLFLREGIGSSEGYREIAILIIISILTFIDIDDSGSYPEAHPEIIWKIIAYSQRDTQIKCFDIIFL